MCRGIFLSVCDGLLCDRCQPLDRHRGVIDLHQLVAFGLNDIVLFRIAIDIYSDSLGVLAKPETQYAKEKGNDKNAEEDKTISAFHAYSPFNGVSGIPLR